VPLTGPIPVSHTATPCARGGDGAWHCSACGAEIAYGLVRPEALQTVTVRCPSCHSHQQLAA
jgi:DNA-directed RNA polymerase subunit RPC12/RpoP